MNPAKTLVRRRLGGLKVFDVGADLDAPVVALLHGYGADGSDLAPLAGETPTRAGWRWLFPEAPAPIAPDAFGRGWFPIDEEKLFAAQRTGVAADFSAEDPPQLREAAEAVEAMLREAGVAWERLVLGGFSQGSMVALEVALRAPRPPAGVAILSGNLLAESRWRELAARKGGTRFFQSHGRVDPVLGFAGALRLERLLRDAGWKGSLLAFDAGHCVTPEVLAALGAFLDETVPA